MKARPLHEFMNESQAEAATWLRAFDIGLPASAKTEPWVLVADSCPSHWVIVRVVRGDARPEDNGVYVTVSPRGSITGEDLKRRLNAAFNEKPSFERPNR